MTVTQKNILLIITITMLHTLVYATGPSWIESKMNPISINENGEILCRTRFSKNEMGAHSAMKIVYGYCVITTDSIIQYKTQEIEPDGFPDYDTFLKFANYWDSIFNSCFNKDHLSVIGYRFKSQYHFDSCNISSYKLDKIQSISEFESNKQIDLKINAQLALNGAKSTDYFDNTKIHIMYDFGKVVIIKNVNNEFEETQIGADFDYFNPLAYDQGITENIGFEISEVSGVLRIK